MKKLTKIVATLGPACDTETQIRGMIKAGANVFRFNLKHNDLAWHGNKHDLVRKVSKVLGVRVGTLMDLQGPEVRLKLGLEQVKVRKGDMITLGGADPVRKEAELSHPQLFDELVDGMRISLDDGAFNGEVVRKGRKVFLKIKTSGVLGENKTLNVPGAATSLPVLMERDYRGLDLAKEKRFDFVALSFVRDGEDVRVLRREMAKRKLEAAIVAKIETKKAVENLDSIVGVADGLMIARGDLGVELSLEEVPYWQKEIIRLCIKNGKFVITATQMLQTMVSNSRPTRAEVSDVANATYDMSDALMLSGETASGDFPLEAVRVMRKTIAFNELKFERDSRSEIGFGFRNLPGLVCEAAYELYQKMKEQGEGIAAIVVFTFTGRTARLMSRLRPRVPIFAFCQSEKTARSISVNYAVTAIIQGKNYRKQLEVKNSHVLAALGQLKRGKVLKKGDKVLLLHGDRWAVAEGTSTLKVLTIDP